jgi:iron complex outermembrane receptor protein
MKHYLAPLIVGGALFGVAHAQDAAEPVTEPVVVTANRFEQPAGTPAVGVTVISGEQIRASGVQNLPQLLSQQSGIGFRDSTGSPDLQVDMRGFGATGDQNTLVLVDGLRLNDNELASVRWSSIPLESIERVEILRGSGAVLYGGGASGGVINIITRNPAAGDRSATVQARGGSYNANGVAASGALSGERIGLRFSARYDETDNYRDHNALRQRNADLTLRTLGPGAVFTFSAGAEGQDLQLPGARTNTQLQTDRRGATTPDDYADRESGYARGSVLLPTAIGDFAADLGYRSKQIDALYFGFTNFSSEATVWTFNPRLRTPYEALGLSHLLVVGADLDYWDYDSIRTGPAHVKADQANEAFYLQHTTDFPTQTRLLLGGRAQRVEYEARDGDSGAPYASGSQDRDLYAWEAALRQALSSSTTLYGKAGRSFRVATLDEIYSQFGGPFFDPVVAFLEPQTSNDGEIGVEFAASGWQARVAAYYMAFKNEIHFNPVTFSNVNLPPTERQGLEVDVSGRLGRRFDVAASYTYAEAEFREGTMNGVDVTGNTVPLVPRHRASATLGFLLAQHTRLSATAVYTGEQYFDGDEANDFGQKMPDYTTVDLRLAHETGPWTLSAAVYNLFDEEYFSYGVRSQFTPGLFNAYPAPERNLFFSAQYRFGP